MGNGIANIVAALIIAGAILWNGGFLQDRLGGASPEEAAITEDEFRKLYARAVGDIRNDIVVNCGCCGEGGGARRAGGDSF